VLFAAGGAFVDFRAGGKVIGAVAATLAAAETIRPFETCEGFDAGSLVRVLAMKSQNR
jgi:hypothetical protein